MKKLTKKSRTIFTVPLHVGQNIEVPKGSKVTFYDREEGPEWSRLAARYEAINKTVIIVKIHPLDFAELLDSLSLSVVEGQIDFSPNCGDLNGERIIRLGDKYYIQSVDVSRKSHE